MGLVSQGDAMSGITLAAANFTALATDTVTAAEHKHPDFGHLFVLVLEAVLEVVCVGAPGYIAARLDFFNGEAQKTMANLNMNLFTPCLIFSKLAKQLTTDTLEDLVVIPFILAAQTLFSWIAAKIAVRLFRLRNKPQANFVTAMAVFGNSNSLPISLVASLAHTISGLHWDQKPGDTDDSVAGRGILYLLVFSQLGQALRWSWGMNALLKPLDKYTAEERGDIADSELGQGYTDETPPHSPLRLTESQEQLDEEGRSEVLDDAIANGTLDTLAVGGGSKSSGNDIHQKKLKQTSAGELVLDGAAYGESGYRDDPDAPPRPMLRRSTATSTRKPSQWKRTKVAFHNRVEKISKAVAQKRDAAFKSLPVPIQKTLTHIKNFVTVVLSNVWACMNPPLVAILVSVTVALIPRLQAFFFTPKTFVNNSVTSAIEQSAGVAIPLILVILGGNLAGNTLPEEDEDTPNQKEERNMLIASLLCRMVIPTICMAPLLAVAAKYVPISTLDDPIFLIVCFLLTGAPSALQLAQMCQVNNVYVGVVSNLLLHSYVFWILPSTLVLVLLALEVVEFAS